MKFIAIVFLLISPFCFSNTIDDLTAKAQSQDPNAQYQLGQRYLDGDGVEPSSNEAIYWLEQSASNGNHEAVFSLTNLYLENTTDKKQTDRAIYWLTTLAVSGSVQMQTQLGKVYERLNQLDLAKIWYQVAAKNSEDAQRGYERVLEKQFNAQRAKQVSSIDQLGVAFEGTDIELDALPQPELTSEEYDSPFAYVSAALTLLLLLLFAWHRKKVGELTHASQSSISESQQATQSLQKQVKAQTLTIKQQKRQLDTLYRQFKKLQASKAPASQGSASDNKAAVACALLGFQPSKLPDSKEIKVRYKQLCKIYHPDRQGSEEEMKRLNSALKVALNIVNK